MKILITGVNGLVGKDVGYYLGFNSEYELYGFGRSPVCYAPRVKYVTLNLLDTDKLHKYLNDIKPEVIIHCAAMTKIDQCENEQTLAESINVDATKKLAEYGVRMIYMSSDGVFSGNAGKYSESSVTDAQNFYGKTKARGEKAIFSINKNAVALRMSIFGYNINNNKSVTQWAAENIKNQSPISGFTDVIINPLYTKQIVQVMKFLLKSDFTGVLNIGCRELVSKYELFCMLAKKMSLPSHNISPTSVESMFFRAPRTRNTSLNVDKLKKEFGIEFSIQDGIDEFYNDYLRWL